MATLGTRIKEARLALRPKASQQALADYVGVSREAVSQWESGDTKGLRPENLIRAAEFLRVDVRELVLGKTAVARRAGGAMPKEPTPTLIFIDRHRDVRLGAGPGVELVEGDVDQIAFRDDWLRTKGWNPAALRAASADGRSMEPRIHHGDLILFNVTEREIRDGKVYVLSQNRALRIKRLFMRYDGALRICSDNPSAEFAEEIVPKDKLEHIEIIGRVVWIGGSV